VTYSDTMSDQWSPVKGVRCDGDKVTVRFEILEVRPGSAYKDTCISDVSLYGRTSEK
jgi:hypothetical protein